MRWLQPSHTQLEKCIIHDGHFIYCSNFTEILLERRVIFFMDFFFFCSADGKDW